jgi:hypothetical protein
MQCYICRQYFGTQRQLTFHLKKGCVHERDSKVIECPFCGVNFSNEYRNVFKRHLSVFHPEKCRTNVLDDFEFVDDVKPSADTRAQFD